MKSKISSVGLASVSIALFSVAIAFLLGVSTSAVAEIAPFCTPGIQGGKCEDPHGIAVDTETGRVYVADSGNNRVDVFRSDGIFLFTFGWGVKTGANELQTCTTGCQAGIAGAGLGQFSSPSWIAVDNDAASSSRHDVYVGTDNFRVQKFDPNGELVKAFGTEGHVGKQGTGACEFAREKDPIAVGSGGNVYVADSFDKDGPGSGHVFVSRIIVFSSSSSGACSEIELPNIEGDFKTIQALAVDSTGHIYVTVEADGRGIRKYSPSGVLEKELDVATETTEGLFTPSLSIDTADNLFAEQLAERLLEGETVDFFTEYSPAGVRLKHFGYLIHPGGLVVPALAAYHSPSGDLYANEGSQEIKYLQLPPPGPVIASVACKVKAETLGSSKATLQARVDPEGKQTTFRFEYVTQDQFELNEWDQAEITDPSTLPAEVELEEATIEVKGLKPETKYHCRVVAENVDSATPVHGEEGTFTTLEGFEFGPAWSGNVGETSATIFVDGNPLETPATGQIEYVEDAKYQPDHSFAEAQSAPAPELDFGNGNTMKLVQVTLSGLKPGTLYHYRLRARNGTPPEGLICPERKPACPELEHTFRTYSVGAAGAGEADHRRYELVSPGEKNSAEVGVFGPAAGFFEDRAMRIVASAGSGEAVTYTSWTSFGQAEGSFAASQYLSKRTEGGWVTANTSPFGFVANVLDPPYLGFTPDLGYGAFKTTEPPLTGDCRKGSEDMYLRDNETGALRCLSPEISGGPNAACLVFAGAREDGGRVFVAGRPEGGESYTYSLYESTPSGIQLISVLPSGEPAPATPGTSFGPSRSSSGPENCQVSRTRLSSAISSDGSKVFWTYVPEASVRVTPTAPGTQKVTVAGATEGDFTLSFQDKTTAPIALKASAGVLQAALESLSTIGAGNVEVSGSGPYVVTFKGALSGTEVQLSSNAGNLRAELTQLLVRVDNSKTNQLDAPPPPPADQKNVGKGPAGGGVFWAAAADGSVAYFTATGRLTSSSKAAAGEPDLYRYELGNAEEPLTDITKGSVPGNVQGVVGASEDGSYVYFVAKAALTGEATNGAGLKAEKGGENLYLYHEGQLTFIATLAAPENGLGRDESNWSSELRRLSARVSADGRHLAFLSIEAQKLAGYENTRASGKPCEYSLNENSAEFIGSSLCSQAFLYDADSGKLTCASCNPSGARPKGPTIFPNWSNGFEGPRYLSNNGKRLLFVSFDSLLPTDISAKGDVYEFELPGEGTCSEAAPAFDPVSGGCHLLVSSGKSSDESFLIDASSDGHDIFFSTRDKLVGWDVNENFDIYDYREGGGFAEPVAASVCGGEAGCVPPASPPPAASAPATPGFSGPGNAKPKKQKPKKKKHKQAKHKKKAKHAGKQRRAGR